MSGDSYDAIRRMIHGECSEILKYAVVYCDHAKRKVIMPDDLVLACKRMGIQLYF